MSRCRALFLALYQSKWFFNNSWVLVSDKGVFFTGVIQAWYRFIVLEYKHNRNSQKAGRFEA